MPFGKKSIPERHEALGPCLPVSDWNGGVPVRGERTPPFHVARIGISYPELNNSVLAAGPFLAYVP